VISLYCYLQDYKRESTLLAACYPTKGMISMTTVRDVCDHLKTLAPLNLAEEWDNVGLLLGDDNAEVTKVITCLTLTTGVAAEAADFGAQLVVTHHPVMFKPIKQITTSNAEGRMLLTLLRNGIGVYSPHTAWDNSASGINQQLAELFELKEIAPLRQRAVNDQVKLVTFVPAPHLDAVRKALWDAGAGVIGNYRQCSFNLHGTGTFFGSDSTNPAVGQSGQFEQVEEVRVEVVCPSKRLDHALALLRMAHPYEEPAVDVFSVKAVANSAGAGRFGILHKPLRLKDLSHIVSDRLKLQNVQFVGDPSQLIYRLGIACGAATEFLRDAQRTGCQALLTGEARFHSCLEAEDMGLGMILPGHYATERFSMEALAKRLSEQFPGLIVSASEKESDPVQTIVSKM
jgi:dinuclear metal center YbgI/SA1388 family protein